MSSTEKQESLIEGLHNTVWRLPTNEEIKQQDNGKIVLVRHFSTNTEPKNESCIISYENEKVSFELNGDKLKDFQIIFKFEISEVKDLNQAMKFFENSLIIVEKNREDNSLTMKRVINTNVTPVKHNEIVDNLNSLIATLNERKYEEAIIKIDELERKMQEYSYFKFIDI